MFSKTYHSNKRKRHQLKLKRKFQKHQQLKKYTFRPDNIKYNISQLPKDLQGKLYIYCFRRFWRSYFPVTSQIPSWYKQSLQVKQELYEASVNNIHFMHLDMNTLPENKQWILGCQCSFCLNDRKTPKKIKKRDLRRQRKFSNYVKKKLPDTDSHWNDRYYYIGSTKVKVFDPIPKLL